MQCSSEMRHAEIKCDPQIQYAARRYDIAVAARRNDMRPADMITLLLTLLYLRFLLILRGGSTQFLIKIASYSTGI